MTTRSHNDSPRFEPYEELDNVSISHSSTSTLRSSNLPPNYHDIKKDIRRLDDISRARCYLLEHEEELSQFKTELLNSWLTIPDHEFHRSRQILRLGKVSETRRKSLQQLTADLAVVKNDVNELRELINELYKLVRQT
jgi:hypothetical protein